MLIKYFVPLYDRTMIFSKVIVLCPGKGTNSSKYNPHIVNLRVRLYFTVYPSGRIELVVEYPAVTPLLH